MSIDGTAVLLNDYTDVVIRYKKNYNDQLFTIVYDEIYSTDFIRKTAVLNSDGQLSNIVQIDIITEHILDNINTDVADFTTTAAGNYINITDGTLSINDIYLGERKSFDSIN